jgi:hypothetical protein
LRRLSNDDRNIFIIQATEMNVAQIQNVLKNWPKLNAFLLLKL